MQILVERGSGAALVVVGYLPNKKVRALDCFHFVHNFDYSEVEIVETELPDIFCKPCKAIITVNQS